MFNDRKSAQIAAFLLERAGGALPILKLMKLMYLSDREAMNRYGEPITYDAMVSMPHGPVLSRTYEHVNGLSRSSNDGWDSWISDRAGHNVALAREFERNDLDELSDADLEVIQSVWNAFGGMDKWSIRDYTHDHCSEWRDPCDSSNPIEYKDVFLALGKSEAVAQELHNNIIAQKQVNRIFAEHAAIPECR